LSDTSKDDVYWMNRALVLAHRAGELDEVPVGAVVVLGGREVGAGFNAPITRCDPTAHAEVRALRDAAARVGNYRLTGASLYVTLEPCTMCVGALVHSRISRLVYGAAEPKAGAVVSARQTLEEPFLNWRVEVAGRVLEARCSEMLSEIFARRRQQIRRRKEAQKGL